MQQNYGVDENYTKLQILTTLNYVLKFWILKGKFPQA